MDALSAAHLALVHLREPRHPETGRPLSLLLTAASCPDA
jgi:hypothetical protein